MTHRKRTLTASQLRIFERLLSFGPPSLDFPDPRKAYPEGVVAIGGRIDVPTLLAAYRLGIFPWPQDGLPLLWFCPEQRGILEFDQIHVGKSLRKFMRQHTELEVTINKGFRAVIENCQRQPRPNQNGSWIIPEMLDPYQQLSELNYALSVEVWERFGNYKRLVGGIYGVNLLGVFSGESMFFHRSNASKVALWHCIEHLRSLGHQWMDIQMVTSVTQSFGGRYISRDAFLRKLAETQREYILNTKD